MTLVSRNIRYLRRLHGLTQEEFSKKIGIKRSLLGAYEEERASPNLTNLVNMSKAFGISVDDLITIDIRKVRESASVFPEGEDSILKALEILESKAVEEDLEEEIAPLKEEKRVSKKEKVTPILPKHTKQYPTIQEELFSKSLEPDATTADVTVPLVKLATHTAYLAQYEVPGFVENLPQIQLSVLETGPLYRAFEMDKDFPVPQSIVVGKYLKNWYQLESDATYVLATQKYGIVYAKVNNQLQAAGKLEITMGAALTTVPLLLRDIFEVWTPVLWFSTTLPPVETSQQTQRLQQLMQQLQQEWDKWQK